MSKIDLAGEKFDFLDALPSGLTVPDCFVFGTNKLGKAHGEAKFYVGSKEGNFFDFKNQKSVTVLMLKSDILLYLEAVKNEYMNPTQKYRKAEEMPSLWGERYREAQKLPDIITFPLTHEAQITGTRCYVKAIGEHYNFIRKVALPLISYIAVMKLFGASNQVVYYWRLFADFLAMRGQTPLVYTYGKGKQLNASAGPTATSTGSQSTRVTNPNVRHGQQKYREQVLKLCPFCPLTAVGDERLLIASHIKPFAACSDSEKYDPYNGYMLTPLYDRLFDRGLMTFTDDKIVHFSQLLPPSVCDKLRLKDNAYLQLLPMEEKHKGYLEYHRKIVFTGKILDS